MTSIDLTILEKEHIALAKITAILADLYFSNCLKKDYNIDPISNAYTTAFNLCPNYRLVLADLPGYEKYKHLNPLLADITSLPVDSKPLPKPD